MLKAERGGTETIPLEESKAETAAPDCDDCARPLGCVVKCYQANVKRLTECRLCPPFEILFGCKGCAMFKLVIFDFDETLVKLGVDWARVKRELVHFALKEGLDVDPHKHLILLSNEIATTPERKIVVDETYKRYEKECIANGTFYPFPAMIELVKYVEKKGYKIAIASGNHTETIDAVMKNLGIASEIDFVCGRDQVTKNKPDPEQLNLIIKKFGMKKDEVLFVGNSQWDEIAGNAAGVRTIIIKDGSDTKRILEQLFELEK